MSEDTQNGHCSTAGKAPPSPLASGTTGNAIWGPPLRTNGPIGLPAAGGCRLQLEPRAERGRYHTAHSEISEHHFGNGMHWDLRHDSISIIQETTLLPMGLSSDVLRFLISCWCPVLAAPPL